MKTAVNNYQQENKVQNKQTIILAEAQTAETDELDPKYHEDETNDPIPSDQEDENQDTDQADLNHTEEDDLSINKPESDLF